MRTHGLWLAGCVVALAGCSVEGPEVSLQGRAHVMVQGEARLEVVPDQLLVRLTVEATDEDLARASNSVNNRVNAALEAIRAAGVTEADLRALGIRVAPVYDWVERLQVFRGHHVSRGIEFTLNTLDQWPGLVEALIGARVDRIDEVRPSHSRADQLRRESLAAAVADAEARAHVLAGAAGARLGRAWTLSEMDRGFAAPRMEAMALRSSPDAGAAQWEAGTITITASVQATYLLKRR